MTQNKRRIRIEALSKMYLNISNMQKASVIRLSLKTKFLKLQMELGLNLFQKLQSWLISPQS